MEQDNRPSWIKDIQAPGTTPVSITIDGQEYKYTIVDNQIEEGRLPYVVGFTPDGFLMISQKVSDLEKPFILTHEVREKKEFSDLPENQRCLASLQKELKDFQNAYPMEYDNYISRRFAFFNDLVTYYQNPSRIGEVSEGFLQGLLASTDFLHTLSASRN